MASMLLFNSLYEIGAISEIWKYVLVMLQNEYDVPSDLLDLFCIFFSLMDDGNICIPLDNDELKKRFNKKLNSLENRGVINFDNFIDRGIAAVKEQPSDTPLIFRYNVDATSNSNNMFVIYNNWMFTERFFNAKTDIKSAVDLLFKKFGNPTPDEIQDIISKYEYGTFKLFDEQASAIVRAKHDENLIITGGPGTGKTTVIFYLLLELLSMDSEYTVYMAAPSGKAANRIKESIMRSLAGLKPQEKNIQAHACHTLSTIRPQTIHKLLTMGGNRLSNNVQFPKKSIFIIDESSMIDIELFAKLLNAIKQTDSCRVFILGDKDQLPPVQAGDVFGELIEKRTANVVRLTQTSRFSGAISDLTKDIQAQHPNGDDFSFIPDTWETNLQIVSNYDSPDYSPLRYLTINDSENIDAAVIDWYEHFYNNEVYNQVFNDLDLNATDIIPTLDFIWESLSDAKILCAENNGDRGTKRINATVCNHIRSQHNIAPLGDSDFFVGEQVIITKNQQLYDLSNGDIGIIVSIDGKKYMMIKRYNEASTTPGASTQHKLILGIGDYIFYRLHLLPTDAIDSAYAITIHKSQGSEYKNVFVFLPGSEKSPLLNRKILYTAITRTKHAVYIVSDKKNMIQAITTPAERDTQLFL